MSNDAGPTPDAPYGAMQGVADMFSKPLQRFADLMKYVPGKAAPPQPAQQMNWKPEPNDEQKAEMEKEYPKPAPVKSNLKPAPRKR